MYMTNATSVECLCVHMQIHFGYCFLHIQYPLISLIFGIFLICFSLDVLAMCNTY